MPDAEKILDAREVSEMPVENNAQRTKRIKGTDNVGWGMRNRLSRLIGPDGHCQFLPIDHGYFQGPTRCLERPWETVKDLLPYADGLFVTRGVLRSAIDPDVDTPIILRVSGATSVVGKDLANEVLITSMEEIIRLNAAAVGVSVFVGSDYEKETLENLAVLVNECEDYGIPVMAVTAVGKELEKRTARYLALACRIAAELGARIVKTYYASEDFDKVTNGCPVPVVIAGGPKCETELEVFDFVYDGMQKGAIGVNLGRNVWQNPYPLAMMRALNAIIHDKATPKQAQEVYDEIKQRKGEGPLGND
ncbi:MAG: 3-hydroxy-5-phosphonooxypentane-2,4-dione thiolase [Deltaproteobacteria bacterium]|nr:3-hydroxy-5-phosphonooxypentane-2,4-dione thiolase [Deltaproteobacteria bacterium]